MKKGFYYVDEEYISYIKNAEIKSRGFTTVPNTQYANRKKFFYGIVLEVNGIPYYVPITHNIVAKEHAIVIHVEDHHKTVKTGSMRFYYMIPVPKQCVEMLNLKDPEKYSEHDRIRIEREYKFCKSNLSRIQKKAIKAYNDVLSGKDANLLKNSCDFANLEKAYLQFNQSHFSIITNPSRSLSAIDQPEASPTDPALLLSPSDKLHVPAIQNLPQKSHKENNPSKDET